jgi:hypothetical protein
VQRNQCVKEYRDDNASLTKSNSYGQSGADTRYALEYARLSLDYYRMNGRTPDTIAALKRALEKAS